MSTTKPFHIYWHQQLSSTNNKLKELTKGDTSKEYTVICTHKQLAGKGQQGNFWESEANKNLTFSILLHPTYVEIQDQFIISKAVALGVLRMLQKYSNNFSIKWPNDIYYNDKKIGGILIENSICNNVISESVVGIGLNINQTNFISDAPNPISLNLITGNTFQLNLLLDEVLQSIYFFIQQIIQGNTQYVNHVYFENLYRNIGAHLYKDSSGIFKATINGITPYGHLELKRSDRKISTYAFKEVEFIIDHQDNGN